MLYVIGWMFKQQQQQRYIRNKAVRAVQIFLGSILRLKRDISQHKKITPKTFHLKWLENLKFKSLETWGLLNFLSKSGEEMKLQYVMDVEKKLLVL